MTGPLRLLQCGLGSWGRDWARNVLGRVPEVQPAGWVDPSPASLALAQREGGVRPEVCFATLDAALATLRPAPRAVLVTADLPHHAELVRAALAAGLEVLVEKPFAPTVAEARELVDLGEERGRTLMVSQNYRFHAVVRRVAELVRSGELGPVSEVAIDFRRLSEAVDGVRRRHHLEEQPLLVDMSIHHFDLMRLVLGQEPVRVDVRTWRPDWCAFTGPPAGAGILEFDGGTVVSYRGSWVSRGEATPWAGEWRMQFRDAEVRWTGRGDGGADADRLAVRRRRGGAGSAFEDEEIPLGPLAFPDRAGSLHEFAGAVLGERRPESSGRESLGTLALMEAAVASASQGAPVDL